MSSKDVTHKSATRKSPAPGRTNEGVVFSGLVLVAALVVTALLPNSKTALAIVVIFGAIVHIAMLVRGARTLGTRTEFGWMVFVFGLVFWFFAPGIQTVLQDGPLFSPAVAIDAHHRHFVTAVLAICAFAFTFQLGYIASLGQRAQHTVIRAIGTHKPSPKHFLTIAVVLIAIHLTGYLLLTGGPRQLLATLMAGRTAKPIWENVAMGGTAFTPINIMLSSSGVVAGIYGGYLALSGRVRGWSRIVGFGCWMVPIIWVGLAAGTRSTLLVAVAPPILAFSRQRLRRVGGLSSSAIVGGIAALLTLVIASNFIRGSRGQATLEGEIDFEVKDNDLFEHAALSAAIAEREDLQFDSAVLQIFTLPIPRVVWRDKPASKVVPLFTHYVWGPTAYLKGKSNLPSIVGQYLLGWGWFGVLIAGLTLGFLIRLCDDLIRRTSLMQVRLTCMTFITYVFISFRVIGYMSVSVLYITVFFLVISRLRISKRGSQPRGR